MGDEELANSVRVGQEEEGTSLNIPELAALVMSMYSSALDEDLVYFRDN